MNFTTYFSIVKSLPYGCFPISIANAPPSFINYTDFGKYPPLYPGHSILSEYRRTVKHDPEQAEAIYRRRYFNEVLSKLYQGDVLHDCMLIARNWVEKNGIIVKPPSFALVCYESPEKFCHRHLVREWIMEIYPNAIDEFSSWRRWQIGKNEEDVNGRSENAVGAKTPEGTCDKCDLKTGSHKRRLSGAFFP